MAQMMNLSFTTATRWPPKSSSETFYRPLRTMPSSPHRKFVFRAEISVHLIVSLQFGCSYSLLKTSSYGKKIGIQLHAVFMQNVTWYPNEHHAKWYFFYIKDSHTLLICALPFIWKWNIFFYFFPKANALTMYNACPHFIQWLKKIFKSLLKIIY